MFRHLSRFGLLSVIAIALGCSVETQKGRENFLDGKLPERIEKLANQTNELGKYEKAIAERTAKDAAHLTLPIAVIDNGMDLAHPDLVEKYVYRVQNGKVVGVGYDFMGDDEFPAAALINTRLFAFNALEVKNGLIVAGNSNVFTDLAKIDDEFAKLFLAKLANDPILNKSLFKKMTRESFNVFGMYRIIADKERQKTFFDPETYENKKKAGTLVNWNFRENVKTVSDLTEWTSRGVYELLDKPVWRASTDGLSPAFSVLSNLEDADQMIRLIKDTFTEFTLANDLKAGLARVVEFQVQRKHSANIDVAAEADSALGFLSSSLEYHRRGITAHDPILNLREATLTNLLSNIDLFREKTDYPVLTVQGASVFNSIGEGYEKTNLFVDAIRTVKKTAAEAYDTKKLVANIETYKKASDEFVKMRAPELVRLFDENFHSDYTSMYRKYFHRNKHPFLSSMSADESHGTHTSGIVAKQNENLRIYPIRITTRSAMITKAEKDNVIGKFAKDFRAWLAQPVVIAALYAKLPKLIPSGMAEPQTDAERAAFADQMLVNLKDAIDVAFEENTLDFIFFKEFEESVIHVAEQKLKVASISLGAELTNRIPKFSELDPEKDMRTVFQFLNFEFVKFHLGQIISTQGKNTLFVVAAGNSSTWVDGKTHSALPVDLTSRFLKPFENGKDRVAPNNHVTNVLGVGSLNPDDDLSDFTNIILGIRTPMIFAVGEEVLSPIKTTDTSPAMTVINKRLPYLSSPIDIYDTRILTFLKENPRFAALKEKDTADTKIGGYIGGGVAQLDSVVSVFKTHLAMKFTDYREKYNGTSMATPAVAGVIGDLLLQKMEQLKLRNGDIYEHPEFAPEKIVADLMAHGDPLFPEHPEYPQKKIDVRGKYERGSKIQELDAYLDKVIGKAK